MPDLDDEVQKICLLAFQDDDEVRKEWESAEDEELDCIIEQYRDAVKYLRNMKCIASSSVQRNEAEEDIPPHSIPILADVRTYNWRELYKENQFDVIMMDPPWQLATSNPTRGVALSYGQLTNKDIMRIPVPKLQSDGLLFIWVINASFDVAMTMFDKWGYRVVDEIVWAKLTVNRKLAKSNGYYLQHAKEICLVGIKGKGPSCMTGSAVSDVILSRRRGQSQKPDEIYQLIEDLVPGGKYLEIFARKNNLRNYWTSLGNEVGS